MGLGVLGYSDLLGLGVLGYSDILELGFLGYSDLLGLCVLGYSDLLGLGVPDELLLDLLVERPWLNGLGPHWPGDHMGPLLLSAEFCELQKLNGGTIGDQ